MTNALKPSVFLSRPSPIDVNQRSLIADLEASLRTMGLRPRTIGVSDYSWKAPLLGIREVMEQCDGLVALGLRRTRVYDGETHSLDSAAQVHQTRQIKDVWFSSPWPHIEAAMACQIGLPLLVFKEEGVVSEGIFDPASIGQFVFEMPWPLAALATDARWLQVRNQWRSLVLDRFDRRLR